MKKQRALSIVNETVKLFKEIRKSKGLSHQALAEKVGITRPAISHIENGRRKPSLMVALRIAHALDMEMSEVLASIEKKIPKINR